MSPQEPLILALTTSLLKFVWLVRQLASREETSLAELQKELSTWEQQYRTAPGTEGSAKWQLHAEFIQGTYAGIAGGLYQRQEQAAKAHRLAADEQLRRREQDLHQVCRLRQPIKHLSYYVYCTSPVKQRHSVSSCGTGS